MSNGTVSFPVGGTAAVRLSALKFAQALHDVDDVSAGSNTQLNMKIT